MLWRALYLLHFSNLVLDELIKLHKSAVEANADANAALSRATESANDALSQLQSNFALAKQMFQDQLRHDLELSSKKTQSFIEWLAKGMDTIESTLSNLGSKVKAMDSDAATLSEVSYSERLFFFSKRPQVWLTSGRMSTKQTLIPRIWGRISERCFSR